MLDGRPKKPTQLRRLEGNPGHRTIPEEVSFPQLESLAPPVWLKARAAIECWRDLAPPLHAAGVLTVPDTIALALLCDAFARYLRNRNGATMRDVKQWLEQFGMTPATRARIAPAGARSPDSVWEKLDRLGGEPA